MVLKLYVILLTILVAVQCQIDGEWQKDGLGFEYYVSKLLEETQVSWHVARALCLENGGDLTSVHSPDEITFITGISDDELVGVPLWNGLNDLDDWANTWSWSDGTIPSIVDHWADGYPHLENLGEMCAWQWSSGDDGSTSDGKWHNAHCGSLRGFICKRQEGSTDPVTVLPTEEIGGYCPNGYYGAGNKCLKPHHRSVDNGATWEEAVFECRLGPGVLPDIASIHDEQEMAIVKSFMQELEIGLWIGFHRIDEYNPFRWVDNSQITYENWAVGEPSQGGEHCTEVWELEFGTWNNINCDHKRGFVCQTYKDTSNLIPTPNPTQFECPDGFFTYYYSCYRVFKEPGKNWQEVDTECQNVGGWMATSHDGAENAALQVIASEVASPIWLGLEDIDNDGEYIWKDGWDLLYYQWGENEPSREEGGGCVALHIDGKWKDDPCSNVYSYVCKYTTVPPETTPQHIEGSCPDNSWKEYGSSCYYFEKDTLQTKTWPEADAACFARHEHSTLVSIHSKAENKFIYDEMKNSNPDSHTWIGLYRSPIDNEFRWTDFSPIQYDNWAPGEPNGQTGEGADCILMYTSNQIEGEWDDHFCNDGVYNQYVCKMPKQPPVTTPTQGPGSCAPGWSALGAYCYHFRPDDFSTWSQAQDHCSQLFGKANLVSIESRGEDEWIRDEMLKASSLPQDRAYWIGLIKDGALPDFYWWDGTELDYDNWGFNEPNDETGAEKCAEMSSIGTWNDFACDYPLGFVCKMPKCAEVNCTLNGNEGTSDSSGGLSSGETAGVVIGVLIGVVVLAIAAVGVLGYCGIVEIGPFSKKNMPERRTLA